MNVFELFAKLNLDSKGYERSLTTAEKRLNAFGRNAQRIGTSLTAAVTAPIAGLSALAVRAFGEQERAELQLRAALEANGREVDLLFDRYTSLASALQDVTVIGDETTIRMFSQAEALGLTGEAAERAVRNAIGLSSALDLNARSALRYTAVLEEGDTTMLQRYLPALRTIEDESEKVALAQEMLANMFGSATAEAESATGQITQMRNALGDLLEVVGGIVSETLLPFVNRLQELAEQAQELDEDLQRLIVQVSGIAAAIGPLIVAFGLIATGLSAIIALLSSAVFLKFLAGAAVAIGAIAGAMALFGVNIDDVKTALGNLLRNWPVFIQGLRDTWGAFVDYFQAESDRMFTSWDLFTSSIRVGMSGAAIDALQSVEKLINGVIRLFNGFIRRTNEVFGTSLSLAEEFDVTQTAIFQRLERTYKHSADAYLDAADRQVEATGRAVDAVERLEDGLGTMGSAFTDAGNTADDATDKVGDFGDEATNTANSVDDLTEALEKLPDDIKLDPATFLDEVDSSDTINGLKARIATLQQMLGDATTQEVRNAIQLLINEYEATLQEMQPNVVSLAVEPQLETPAEPIDVSMGPEDVNVTFDPTGTLLGAQQQLNNLREQLLLATSQTERDVLLERIAQLEEQIDEMGGKADKKTQGETAVDLLEQQALQLAQSLPLVGTAVKALVAGGGPIAALGAVFLDAVGKTEAFATLQKTLGEMLDSLARAINPVIDIVVMLLQVFQPFFDVAVALVEAALVPLANIFKSTLLPVFLTVARLIAAAFNALRVLNFIPGVNIPYVEVPNVSQGDDDTGPRPGTIDFVEQQLQEQREALGEATSQAERNQILRNIEQLEAQLDRMRSLPEEGPPAGSIAAIEQTLQDRRGALRQATEQAERDRLLADIERLEDRLADMRSREDDGDGRTRREDDVSATFGQTPQGVQLALAVPLLDAATIMQSAANSMQAAFGGEGMNFSASTMSFDSSVERFGSYVDRLVENGISVRMQSASRTAALR